MINTLTIDGYNVERSSVIDNEELNRSEHQTYNGSSHTYKPPMIDSWDKYPELEFKDLYSHLMKFGRRQGIS